MNIVLIKSEEFTPEQAVRLSDYRARHILQVLRGEIGQQIRVGLVNGMIGTGTISALNSSAVELTITLNERPPPPHAVELVLALPRPKVLRRLIAHITAFGVKKIHLIHAAQVEKSYWQSEYLSEQQLLKACIHGLEQARDTMLPEIHQHRLFRPFAEDILPWLIRDKSCWLAAPAQHKTSSDFSKPSVLVVGPESGWVPFEQEFFRKLGFENFSLGTRPLTVEAALPALLSR